MSAAQQLPQDDLATGKGGASIAGGRFGLLTAIRIVEKTDQGNRWLLQCDCGRYAVRTAGSLRQAARTGGEPQCSECLAQLRSGISQERRDGRGERWAQMMKNTGELYSERIDDLHREQIAGEFARFFGFEAEPQRPRFPLEIMPAGDSASCSGQRAAFFVPLSGRAWRCCLCRQLFSEGFGCMACLAVSCAPCVRLELHSACGSRESNWERCMEPGRVGDLPVGDSLGNGVKRVMQPPLSDSARCKLVASLMPGMPKRALMPPKERTAKSHERVVFDWTEFRYESSEASK